MNNYLKLSDNLYCQYCNKQCKNLNSLKNHERLCKYNPNHSLNPYTKHNQIYGIWNKNIKVSKSIKEKISKGVKQYAEINPGKMGRGLTEEKEKLRREKISKSMKNNPKAGGLRYNSGFGKHGWYKSYYCRSTYELVYIIYNIDHNIKFKACTDYYLYEYKGSIHKYYPDFELEDGTIIEIKGYTNEQTKAKINAVKDRPIKVLYFNDLQYAFDYVKNTYVYDKLEDLYEKTLK